MIDEKKNETAYIREIFSRGYEYPIYRFVFARVHREITTTYSFLSNLRAHFITNTGNCWVGIVYGRKAIINIGSLVCADTRWNTQRERERERERERDTVSLFHPYAIDHGALSLKKQIGSRYICSSTPDIFSIANFSQYNITLCIASTSDFKLHFE